MQRSIFITGCSSGIGLRAAKTLQHRGYRVFASARKKTDVEQLKQHGLTDSLCCDINDSTSIAQAVAAIVDATGGTLDAVFNNAGFVMTGAVEDISRNALRLQFETNLFGAVEVIHHVLPIMRAQGHGRIIQNSSILGVMTLPFRGAYNASKFALEGITDTLRQELRGENIHVVLIQPGPVESALRDKAKLLFDEYLDPTQSVFANEYAAMENYFKRNKASSAFALTPDHVVKKLLHALESSRPKTRYRIGMAAHLLAILKTLLPDRAMDFIVSRIMRGELAD